MEFVLFEKLASLEGIELTMLIVGVAAVIGLIIAAIAYSKKEHVTPQNNVKAMVYGALCVALSFVLSYIKLFSMPMGGSLTLCSMLPICAYACMFGPARGFTAAFAYGVLQVIQGAWVVHWAQFLLDYFFAFTCYGVASLFPKKLAAGVTAAGLLRLLCSTLSGAIFFAEGAFEAGWSNAWLYSLAYNGSTIGAETLLCVIVALLPAVKSMMERIRPEK